MLGKEQVMMYSNRFVMSVLIDGQPQKELKNGEVRIPLGSEYALRFRNKNSRRAVVKIFIDGENVSGEGYVIGASDYVDIKRHEDKDRAFKFVSLESIDAQEFGKDGENADKVKGTIEARFYLEKERVSVPAWIKSPPPWPEPWIHRDPYYPYPPPGVWCSNSLVSTCSTNTASVTRSASLSSVPKATEELKDGCTVEGMQTGQDFHSVHIDLEDTCTVLKIFLRGYGEDSVYVSEEEKSCPRNRPKPKRRKGNSRLNDLENENEELRHKLAEIENERLKEELSALE